MLLQIAEFHRILSLTSEFAHLEIIDPVPELIAETILITGGSLRALIGMEIRFVAKKLAILNRPNLAQPGKRQADIYGYATFDDADRIYNKLALRRMARALS